MFQPFNYLPGLEQINSYPYYFLTYGNKNVLRVISCLSLLCLANSLDVLKGTALIQYPEIKAGQGANSEEPGI